MIIGIGLGVTFSAVRNRLIALFGWNVLCQNFLQKNHIVMNFSNERSIILNIMKTNKQMQMSDAANEVSNDQWRFSS